MIENEPLDQVKSADWLGQFKVVVVRFRDGMRNSNAATTPGSVCFDYPRLVHRGDQLIQMCHRINGNRRWHQNPFLPRRTEKIVAA